jgi:hypothetical protein
LETHLNRRDTLRLILAGTGAMATPGLVCARHSDLNEPARLLSAFVRLGASIDERLVIWWMDGVRYGVVNAHAKPLFGMKVGMFHRYRRQTDGNFKLAMFELTYYTDLASGKLLETFDNPYTGQANRVTHVRLGPEIRVLTSNGTAAPQNPMVHDYESSLGPAMIHGEQLWIPTSVQASIRFPKPNAPEILLNIYTTVSGRLSEAIDPDIQTATATLAFQNVLKWEPFMRMGDHPGHMMSRAAGRKLHSVEDLPADYLACAERVNPRLFADPIATLAPLFATI